MNCQPFNKLLSFPPLFGLFQASTVARHARYQPNQLIFKKINSNGCYWYILPICLYIIEEFSIFCLEMEIIDICQVTRPTKQIWNIGQNESITQQFGIK